MKYVHAIPILAVAVALVGSLGLTGCDDPLRPVMPEWDVDANVPFLARTYTMEELLSQDSVISIGSGTDDVVLLTRQYPIEAITLTDALTLENRTITHAGAIGDIEYDIPDLVDETVALASVYPTLTPGQRIVPSFVNPEPVSLTLDASRHFDRLTFRDGKLVFALRNTFPIPMTFTGPARIFDDTRRELGTIAIPSTLPPGATYVLPDLRLAGLSLHRSLTIELHVGTSGSGGQAVTLDADDHLRVTGAMSDTRILDALAYLPAQTIEHSGSELLVQDGSRLRDGVIRTGSLALTVGNHLAVPADVDIVFHGITTGGRPLERTLAVSASGSQTATISLAGASIAPDQERSLGYTMQIRTRPSGNTLVRVVHTDSVRIDVRLRDIVMERMSGTIRPHDLVFDDVRAADLGLGTSLQGSITWTRARMWARMTNHTAVPVELSSGSITGSNASATVQRTLAMPRQEVLPRSEGIIPFRDEDVVGFFNAFGSGRPDRLQVNGTLLLNPPGVFATASERDSITGTVFLEIPMEVAIADGSLVDTTTVGFDQDTRTRLRDVRDGLFHFIIENHLPAGVEVEPQILDQHNRVILTPKTVSGTNLSVPTGVTDSRGRVERASTGTAEMRLSAEDFARLAGTSAVRVRLKLNTAGSAPVVFRTTDYVKVRAFATLRLRASLADGK